MLAKENRSFNTIYSIVIFNCRNTVYRLQNERTGARVQFGGL